MDITLKYYRDYRPSGKIYVFCEGNVKNKEILYSLYQGGVFIEEKKGTGDELLSFCIPSPGTLTLSAKVYLEGRETHNLHSGDIVVPAVPLLPPLPPKQIKSLKGHLALIDGEDNYLEVKFFENGIDKLKNEKKKNVPIYYSLRSHIIFEPRYTQKTIKKISKISPLLEQLADVYKVDPNIPKDKLLALAQEIESLDYVEYCALLSKLTYPPPLDNCEDEGEYLQQSLSDTPNFTEKQLYLDEGNGMNVRKAWARDVSGKEISVHITDFGVEDQHEDLKDNIHVVTSRPSGQNREHGTATIGAIRANNNDFGVTGIAYKCNAYFYEITVSDLDLIVRNFQPGDIVALNIQWALGNNQLVPAVHSPAWWKRIYLLVNAGAVVIFAAGNGGHNLQELSAFNNLGDSGGIMVGACQPDDGLRTSFSNFNLYLSANSWGWDVATTGYGWLFNGAPIPLRRYTGNYSGTSSATPLLAGALALIQSYAKATYDVVLNTQDMISIIESSGSHEAQGQGIGSRPNVNEALKEVDILLGDGTPPPPPPGEYPEWQLGAQYQVGDRVSFEDINYQCLQNHTAHSPTWNPRSAQSLWRPLKMGVFN